MEYENADTKAKGALTYWISMKNISTGLYMFWIFGHFSSTHVLYKIACRVAGR